MIAAIRRWYCREFHPASALSRPISGQYTCFICHECYVVPWAVLAEDAPTTFVARLRERRAEIGEEG